MPTSPHLDARAQRAKQLQEFRAGFYDCLTSWGDALFELTDAALCAPGPISSVPALSLDPAFRRSHGSLYKALAQGEIDDEQMRYLLSRFRPAAWPLIFAVDASVWSRCAPERPPHPERAGRPRRHGRRFKLSDDKTAPKPDAQVRLEDPRYGKVRLRAWHNLHPRLHRRGRWASYTLPPIVPGSVIRVDVER